MGIFARHFILLWWLQSVSHSPKLRTSADLESVVAAALRGKISAYIILSPTVYGRGTGPGNSMSQKALIFMLMMTELSLQLPAYTRFAKENGQAAYIGEGNNIWGNVSRQLSAHLIS